MKPLNDVYVVSLIHWDREWRFPFQKTRMLLGKMMDELLDVLDSTPEYNCFHLDGQTVLLDDYCEARPQQVERLKKHIADGRILIGPWYVLPEENQVSGESLVRNFLWGERQGRKYGSCMKVGYTPTSWGQVSQMPQIMQGFGVDSIVFYRGISADQVKGNYYRWEGADGSRLFGIRLGDHARVAFFEIVDRRVAHNRGPEVDTHDWQWGGKPFRLCGSGSSAPYHFANPPIGWYPERIEEAFTELSHEELGEWETPFALAFDCDDSTGPFKLTPKIIAEANRQITNGKIVKHTDLVSAVREAQDYLKDRKLEVVRGEMRAPQRLGLFTDLYTEVQATRIPMKMMNRRSEFRLHRMAEPLATIAWSLGEAYPLHALDLANQYVLQNHAHDSIGGCGRDEVNDEVEFRFRQADILTATVAEDGARAIAARIDSSRFGDNEILLIVFNPLPENVTQIVYAEIDIARDRGVRGFQIHDMDGNEVGVQIKARDHFQAVFNHPQELPLRTECDRWEVFFDATEVPGLGYRVYRVVPAPGEMRHPGSLMVAPTAMENEHLAVYLKGNGTVDVQCKETGQKLCGQNLFQNRGEVGDYWVGGIPTQDRVYTSHGIQAGLSVVEDGPLRCTLEASFQWKLPIRATYMGTAREAELSPVTVTTRYTLVRGEAFLRIETTIDNTVEDHLFRALFPTGIKTDRVQVEVPFDVVDRVIPPPDTRDWREPYRPTQPQQNFVDLSDGEQGVAILNRGLPQYEAIDDKPRTVALTLIRAHRAWNSVRLARYPDQRKTQLQGSHTFEYALMPHVGSWDSGRVLQAAERFNLPCITAAAGPGPGTLPLCYSFVSVEGDGLVLSSLKKGEWDDSLILRISNRTGREVDGLVRFGLPVSSGEVVDLIEGEALESLALDNNSVALKLAPKKVVTIRLQHKN